MHLKSFAVRGFRSLDDVSDIPVSGPTILAGHNDGGKTAVLVALAFLLGEHKLAEEDRCYSSFRTEASPQSDAPARCELTEVEGLFGLDEWEQTEFDLPSELQVRRAAGEDLIASLEYWGPVPDDERLHDLAALSVKELKDLVTEFGLAPAAHRRAEYEAVLNAHGATASSGSGWRTVPPRLGRRLPRMLSFDGRTAKPDDAVKAALSGRFQNHMADPVLTGQLQKLEAEIAGRLAVDAKSLCDHIRERCPDLKDVFVEPDVSFKEGFRGAPLRISRTAGESVSLERSGLGSNRRVSLAIWEWTSELLTEDTADAQAGLQDAALPPALQTIVVYDEPDTHLDFGHQTKIMKLIRAQSAIPNVRVIVATHSMQLIDGVDIHDVVHLKLESDRTVVERLGVDEHGAIDQHLQRIAAAVGLRNSVLLHERCFLAVEGDSEQRAFPLLFRLSEGLSLQSAGIALWACMNNEGALHLASYLAAHGRTVMLVVDADSKNLPKSVFKPPRLIAIFGEHYEGVVKLVGELEGLNEFEELFEDRVWADVANKAWKREDQLWIEDDFRQHRGVGKFSEAVQQMLQNGSVDGPGGKPEMMYQLADQLTSADEVPAGLRAIFSALRNLAG